MVHAFASAERLTLWTGPPGSGKSERALAMVREAATKPGARGRGARLDAGSGADGGALLVLPTYAAVQHAIRAALSRWDARGLLDAPFATFTSAGERFLPSFRVRSLPSAEEKDAFLAAALARVDVPAFREVADRRGFRARLLGLLKDVKQGETAVGEALAALAARRAALPPGPRERLEGFLAVAEAYGSLLERADLEDHEDTLHRLLAGVTSGQEMWLPTLLAVDGFDDLTPVEEAILLALARRVHARGGEVLVTLPWDESRPGLYASADRLRTRLLALGFRARRLEGFARAPGSALERLALGAFGEDATKAPAGAEVVLLECGDADDEAAGVAREVRALLARAGAPDGVTRGPRDVIVVVPDPDVNGPRMEAALRAEGVPVARTGARPLAADPAVRALRGPLLVLAGRTSAGDFDPHALLDWLRWRALAPEAPIPVAEVDAQEMAWRRDGFPRDWEAFRAATQGAVADALGEVERATTTGSILNLARSAPRVGALLAERDAAAKRAGVMRTGPQAATDLLGAIERATLEVVERRLDVVHVLDPDAARSWEVSVVFLTGLEERALPRRAQEDALLGDDDRARLAGDGGTPLPTSSQHDERERRRVLALLTRAKRRLVLSRPSASPEGDPLPPSPVWQEVLRLLDVAPTAPRSAPPAPPLAPPVLLRAARWRRRASDPLAPVWLPRFAESVATVKVTEVVHQLTCLRRHFLSAVVGLDPDEAPLGGPRVGARDRGTWIHAAFHKALREPEAKAEAIAAAVLEEQPVEGWERRHVLGELARVVTLFRARERATAGPFAPDPAWLERKIGGAAGTVSLGAGGPGALRLRGRIDRVDRAGSRALVVDYKSSRTAPDTGSKAAQSGLDVQLPLYARALEVETGSEVVGLEWIAAVGRVRATIVRADASADVAPRREGRAATELDSDAWRALLDGAERAAALAVARIRAGGHDLAPREAADCGDCPMRGPCRPDLAFLRRREGVADDGEDGA